MRTMKHTVYHPCFTKKGPHADARDIIVLDVSMNEL